MSSYAESLAHNKRCADFAVVIVIGHSGELGFLYQNNRAIGVENMGRGVDLTDAEQQDEQGRKDSFYGCEIKFCGIIAVH